MKYNFDIKTGWKEVKKKKVKFLQRTEKMFCRKMWNLEVTNHKFLVEDWKKMYLEEREMKNGK